MTGPTATTTGIPVRASDADREDVSHTLHEASAAGMLTLAEVEERLAQLYAVRFRHELPELVHDLPVAPPGAARLAGDSVGQLARGAVTAFLALVTGLLTLAGRHPRVAAGVVVGALVLLALVMIPFGMDMEMGADH